MLTLFGNLDSGNVHKVQLILRRAGIVYSRVDVSQPRNEPRSEEYLGINPIGKVPAVLMENGDVLSESGAILYFFSKQAGLWPEQTRAQAEVLRWMFFEQYNHEPSLAGIRYLRRFAGGSEDHRPRIESLQPKALHALEVMQRRLSAAAWLAGENCSTADYALYPYTWLAGEAGFDLGRFPAILSWLDRFEAQPDFLPMYQDGAAESKTFDQYFGKRGRPSE